MKAKLFACVVFLFSIGFAFSTVFADSDKDDKDDGNKFPKNATFTTLITLPRAIEGLTGDGTNNLYTGGSGPVPCPIWQINLYSPLPLKIVGNVQGAVTPAGSCAFSGITFDAAGNLYQADGTAGRIYRILNPNSTNPPDATIFASGVPGTNGLAFDRDGNLWTGDGTTGQGRVWKITGSGANCTGPNPIVKCEEVFRIQPMANEVNLVSGVGGVGRDVRDLPPGVITVTPTTRNATVQTTSPPCPNPPGPPCVLGSQPLVANGLAFNRKGDLFNIDTARGALWKVEFDKHGNVTSPMGCDSTFTANTLCLSNVVVAHPILEGGDGIALDKDENVWVDANERNAVAVVTKKGDVFEIFRNPVNSAKLRNSADTALGNTHILEFPTSPFLSGKVLCTSMSDGDRRDNSPRAAGEVNAGLPVNGTNLLGKISCMDQELKIPGLPLPIH
jgi:sugar lactone lactonase YvrE